MLPIEELYWDPDLNNVNHIAERDVTPEDIEEIVFGIEGEPPKYLLQKGKEGSYVVSGQTGSGRLLRIAGEFLGSRVYRPFGARDMNHNEQRAFKGRVR